MTNKFIYGTKSRKSQCNDFHYVYRITNLIEEKHYYGVRSCKIDPYKDIGTKYFCQITQKDVKWIIQDQKENPQNYKYKIVSIFANRQAATEREIFLHKKYNVKNSSKFYNQQNQTSIGFDTTGKVVVRDTNGINFLIDKDKRHLLNDLMHPNTGYGIYRNSKNETVRIHVTEAKRSDEYLQIQTGFSIYIEKISGQILKTRTDDPRIATGDLIAFFTGKSQYINIKTGDRVSLHKLDPVLLGGEYVQAYKNHSIFKDRNGKTVHTSIYDTRVLSGELIGATSGKAVYTDPITGKMEMVQTNDDRVKSGKLKSMHAGRTNYISTSQGDIIHTTRNDPRVISGELIGITSGKSQYKHKFTGECILTSKDDDRVISGEYISVNSGRNKGKKRVKDEFGKTRYV